MTTLAEIFRRHGTDKATHGYAAFYETLPAPARLLEVGVFKGASLRAWREWWPEALVVGLDLFERHPQPEPNSLYTFKVDSRTWKPPSHWAAKIGLLVDDGSHHPRDQAATFRNLWPLVAPNGVYCIEDVFPFDLSAGGVTILPPYFATRIEHFNSTAYGELNDAITQSGGEFTCHDYRAESGKPDSVLFVIRKPA